MLRGDVDIVNGIRAAFHTACLTTPRDFEFAMHDCEIGFFHENS